MLDGFDDRSAIAFTNLAYCDGRLGDPIVFSGQTEGVIVEPRNVMLDSWDCVFEVQGTGKTYSQMTMTVKNYWSERGKAVREFVKYIRSLSLYETHS